MTDFNAPSIKELLEKQAEKYKEKTYIKFIRNGEVEERSYSKLCNDSKAFMRYIRNISDKKMHIAVIGKTSYEYITCISGIIMSGSVVIPFAPEITKEEASVLFKRADIDFLIYDDNFGEFIDFIKKTCPFIKHCKSLSNHGDFEKIYEEYSDTSVYKDLSDFERDNNDCAVIIFTSGTTGIKKGVMLSSNALVGNIMYHDYCTAFNENDATLSVLPMHHVFCFSGDYIKNLKDGVQVCLNEKLGDLLNNIKVFEPNVIRVVPMIAQHLLQRIKIVINKNPEMSEAEAAQSVLGKNLKWLISGGAYLNPELVDEFEKFGVKIRQGYGMTEAGCRISVPDEDVSAESVGRVIDMVEVRTQNGEIQVNTPTKMLGYYKMIKETKEMFTEDGWLKTGDIGYVTEDGQLFITGRVKNLIILSSGENVSPEAIEKKFKSYELVEEIMVWGEGNNLVAEIFPNRVAAQTNDISDIKKEIENIVDEINADSKPSHFISKLIVRDTPLEKTSSGKIKRKTAIL